MRYRLLACDYDNTLAIDGRVDESTHDALRRCHESGRKAILVTGRELDDLLQVESQLELFEWVVAENGALLYRPTTGEVRLLGTAPPERFVRALRDRGVQPLSAGRVVVSTRVPYDLAVLEAIRQMQLELQVIFNRGAVMVLPAGVTKASGLAAALETMDVSFHNVLAVGDGENDHALLTACEAGVAVANAVPTLREKADLVTHDANGKGVAEVIGRLLANDLADLDSKLHRHDLLLGHCEDGRELYIPSHGANVLIAGTSGSGKSTVATALMERLADKKYQFCVIDPEGDYDELKVAVSIGTPQQPPELNAVMALLEKPDQNVSINMLGVSLTDRPRQFVGLLGQLLGLRAQTDRPHWIVLDEAHHVLPVQQEEVTGSLVEQLSEVLMITVEPDAVAPAALARMGWIVVIGKSPQETLSRFCRTIGEPVPSVSHGDLGKGTLLVWHREAGTAPILVKLHPGQSERRRHNRKYAEGELPPEHVFYFRGADNRLNLPAQNLVLFLQIAEGIDEETWLYHLRRGDYSRWFRTAIKDQRLADEALKIEGQTHLSAGEIRDRIRALIESHYTLPASSFPK